MANSSRLQSRRRQPMARVIPHGPARLKAWRGGVEGDWSVKDSFRTQSGLLTGEGAVVAVGSRLKGFGRTTPMTKKMCTFIRLCVEEFCLSSNYSFSVFFSKINICVPQENNVIMWKTYHLRLPSVCNSVVSYTCTQPTR